MASEDQDYFEWLAAAPKGVRWDRAQEMYELYQERRREQAELVAKRLLGKPSPVPPRTFETLEQERARVFGSCDRKCGEASCLAWHKENDRRTARREEIRNGKA